MSDILTTPAFKKLLGDKWIAPFKEHNIRHVEQIVSLLLNPAGRLALERLGLPVKLSEIQKAANAFLKTANIAGLQSMKTATEDPLRPRNVWTQARRGMGFAAPQHLLRLDYLSEVPAGRDLRERANGSNGNNSSATDSVILGTTLDDLGFTELEEIVGRTPVAIWGEGELPQVKDQRYRGTCVAFTVSAMLEAFIHKHVPSFSRSTRFSEQYLYYRAKVADPNKVTAGTQFEVALLVLSQYGVCADHFLPYRGYNDWGHSLLFEKAQYERGALDDLAKKTRVDGYLHLPTVDLVESIKTCIRRGLAVGVGVLVFKEAWENDYAITDGEIELPIVVRDDEGKPVLLDTCVGGHAVAICGYVDDEEPGTARPGGGAFIFRNSWGEDWGSSSPYAVGYGCLPYEYVEKYCLDSCIITGLRSDG